MSAFYIALVLGGVVAVFYLYLVLDGFGRVREAYRSGASLSEVDAAADYDRQGRGFSWVAGLGVVASSTLIILASANSTVWYVLPFLGIGTAVAVVVAFLHDRGDLTVGEPAREEAKHR